MIETKVTKKSCEGEAKAFFVKMIGDYYRYIAENAKGSLMEEVKQEADEEREAAVRVAREEMKQAADAERDAAVRAAREEVKQAADDERDAAVRAAREEVKQAADQDRQRNSSSTPTDSS